MNILCKLLGHRTCWSLEQAFRDLHCIRKGCSYIEKGLKYLPMPECKPPREVDKIPSVNWKQNFVFTNQELRDLKFEGIEKYYRQQLIDQYKWSFSNTQSIKTAK